LAQIVQQTHDRKPHRYSKDEEEFATTRVRLDYEERHKNCHRE
jgi:hypothetical protein